MLESKSAALVAAFFVDFPENKIEFSARKQARYRTAVQFVAGRPPHEEFFACPMGHAMEVGACVRQP